MIGYLLLVVFAYLLGAFPTAYIAGRVTKGIDIRQVGDRNMGGANAFRELGKPVGIAVFVIDVSKGIGIILVARAFAPEPVVLLAGVAAVLGHIFPPYIGFRGGRGAATALAILFFLLPLPMIILASIGLVPYLLTRNNELAAGILFGPLWLVALLMGAPVSLAIYSVALPAVVGLAHYFSTRSLPRYPQF